MTAPATQAVIENVRQERISRLRACCTPLAVVGVDEAHSPDLCGECKKHAAALRRWPR